MSQSAHSGTTRPSVLAITSQIPWPLDRGGHLRSYYMLRALAERCHVRMVTGTPEHAEDAVAALARVGITVAGVPLPPRTRWREAIRAVSAVSHQEPYVLYRRHGHRSIRARVEAELRAHRPAIVYLDHLDSFQFARACRGLPFVVDLHNVYSRLIERAAQEEYRGLTRVYLAREARLLARIEHRAASEASLLFAVSEDERRHFMELGAPRVHLAPNGVDCQEYDALPTGRRTGSPVILYLGTMSWSPNAGAARFLAEEVLPEVRRLVPDARLRIVGRDPLPEVQALAALDGVEVTGGVPDVKPHLRDAHVLAVPLEAGGGTRLKILEAFAAGLPVVSTAVGSEGIDAVSGTHLTIAPRPEFARAIVSLLQDHEGAAQLAGRARTLARERYDWHAVGEAASRAVVNLLASHDRSAA